MKKFARIEHLKIDRYAELRSDQLHILKAAPWESTEFTGEVVALSGAKWLVPSAASKVVAVGQNYLKHAQEMGKPVPVEPLIFIKPSTALNAHNSPIVLPLASKEVHHEAELALVIGQKLKNVTPEDAEAGIFGVTCFNDVTARDIQKREIQHTRGKSYDTFACAGPFLVTGIDFSDLRVMARVNGVLKQDGRTSDMIFSPAKLVSFISQIMTLLPGDLVSTGTPSGVGPILEGDVVEIEIENVGVLRNPVIR